MTDKELDQLKHFFDKYSSKEEFIEKYISVKNPSNSEAIIQLFDDAHQSSDVWEFSKYLRSTETLRLDKIMSENKNITIEEIVECMQKYDLSQFKRIIIRLDNKDYEDMDKLANLGINIYIRVSGDKGVCTLDEFKEMRAFFDKFTNKYSTEDLSVLEKITLAYDYVKSFSYNEQNDDKRIDSRSIAKSINSGNIVCEGYSRIFCQLLDEMGISSNLVFIEPNEKEKGGHVRVMVDVKDEKYNVSDVFAFDPTWDSNQNMSLVTHADETTGYEIESWQKPDDKVIEEMPSDIRYLFFMVPIHEYSKYFDGEQIEKIEKYPSGKLIEMTSELMVLLNYDDNRPKDNFVFKFISDLLYKTKEIEGYGNEQIEEFIHHAVEILNQDRYGRFDKNRTQENSQTIL